MARITVEDCLKQTGHENRFSLIHLALERVKQHREGLPVLVEGKNKEVVMTLREIAAGVVSADNIYDFTKTEVEDEVDEEVSEAEESVESSN
jgi:DNA-directed RNA polymerase subunit omega